MLPDAVIPPYLDHTYAQWLERSDSSDPCLMSPVRQSAPGSDPETPFKLLSSPNAADYIKEDIRKCSFCGEFGDMRPLVC